MTPEELAMIGRKLYGPAWKAKLAKALARHPGAVTHWMKGKSRIPNTVVNCIRDLASHQPQTKEGQSE